MCFTTPVMSERFQRRKLVKNVWLTMACFVKRMTQTVCESSHPERWRALHVVINTVENKLVKHVFLLTLHLLGGGGGGEEKKNQNVSLQSFRRSLTLSVWFQSKVHCLCCCGSLLDSLGCICCTWQKLVCPGGRAKCVCLHPLWQKPQPLRAYLEDEAYPQLLNQTAC